MAEHLPQRLSETQWLSKYLREELAGGRLPNAETSLHANPKTLNWQKVKSLIPGL
jgi:hypothetical protein